MVGSESRLFGLRDESGRYSETRIGQILSRENEYDQCEHGKTGE